MTLRTASDTLPRIRPFLVNSRKLFVDLQPGTAALAVSADTIASALRAGIPVLRASPQLNDQLPPTAAALRRVQRQRRRPHRARPPGRPLRGARPAAAVHRAGAVGLQLRDAAVPQRRRRDQQGQCERQLAARQRAQHPVRTQQRGQPVLGAGERRSRSDPLQANFLHDNPYPNTRLAGPEPDGVRGGQRGRTRSASR